MQYFDEWPRITVVTPSYNQGQFLKEAIKSVINQDYPNLEYFIVDGGSTDNSVDIIKKYEDRIDWWISKPDKGQSDALNKGFNRATGDYLTWVNSDDILLPGVLSSVGKVIKETPSLQWIAGNTIWVDTEDKIIRCSRLPHYSRLLAKMGFLMVGGPSTFFARSLYQSVDGLRSELSYNMDGDLWCQFEGRGIHYHRISEYLTAFRVHGKSKTSAALFRAGITQANQKMLFSRFIKPQYEERQKKERDLSFKRYNKRKSLNRIARLMYRGWQIVNGNYLRAFHDVRRMYGRRWQEIFHLREGKRC